MKALILAAGYATRLYPLTKEYPKPLLEVNKEPIIDYAVRKLEKLEGVDEIIVITNSKFISQFKKWAKGLKTKKRITVVDDKTKGHNERLGAIGDMAFAIENKQINDDLIVIGGDNLFDGDLEDFVASARLRRSRPMIGVYNIKNKKMAAKYGVVELGRGKRLIGFQEKPKAPKTALVAMCLYYFPRKKLSLIKEYFEHCDKKCDAAGHYIDWLRKKEMVYGFVFKGAWYDIGQIDSYKAANRGFLEKEKSHARA